MAHVIGLSDVSGNLVYKEICFHFSALLQHYLKVTVTDFKYRLSRRPLHGFRKLYYLNHHTFLKQEQTDHSGSAV
jgi:hypothetical protein